jgi:hypothetical protein
MPSSRSGTNAHCGSSTISISLPNSPPTYDTFLDRTTLSPTLSLASNPSLHHHPTTHWPHFRRATTNLEHFWRQIQPYCSRSNKLPAPRSPSTVTSMCIHWIGGWVNPTAGLDNMEK